MNEITVFENPEFGTVRTLAIDGEPWFVGRDVAEILGYSNTRDALARHVDSEDKGVVKHDTLGGAQELTVVNESGLYSLILGSKLPTAKKFKHWVTSEVLPAIRRHGLYAVDDLIANPDLAIKALTALKEEREKNRGLESKVSLLTVSNEMMRPKAEYFDELVDRGLLTNLRDTAKELHVRQNDFVQFLLTRKYLYRSQTGKLLPYAQHVDDGLFELKEFTNGKTGFASTQTLVTPKGKETFRLLMV